MAATTLITSAIGTYEVDRDFIEVCQAIDTAGAVAGQTIQGERFYVRTDQVLGVRELKARNAVGFLAAEARYTADRDAHDYQLAA